MLWNSPGIHLESSGIMEWWWNQHHHSMWNPDGIWPFHVDSMWNIGGMESPKRVGSQPKYIPSGMSGIHLE